MAAEGKAADGGAGGGAVDDAAFKWCQRHTVEMFPFEGEVTVINARMSREDAYEELAAKHLLSAPVYDEARKKYLGMVDMGDIVAYLIKSYSDYDHSTAATFTTLRALIGKVRAKSADVVKLVDLSQHDHFKPMPVRTPLLMLVARLAGYPETLGVRRVAIADPETHKVVKIISQSAIIKAFAEHIDELGPTMEKSLEQVGVARKDVISVKEDEPALRAFQLMNDNNISAVAVVDADTGKLMSSISNSDVRVMLKQNRMQSLAQDSMDFVAAVRSGDVHDTASGKSKPAVVAVHREATVGDVIKKLAKTGLHRVYVEDDAGLPIGVVSLKDLLHLLVVDVGKSNDWAGAIYMAPEYVETLGYV